MTQVSKEDTARLIQDSILLASTSPDKPVKHNLLRYEIYGKDFIFVNVNIRFLINEK